MASIQFSIGCPTAPCRKNCIRQSFSIGKARRFYESEGLRGGWSVWQLDRQISSQFYERTPLSKKNKSAMLRKGLNCRLKIWSLLKKRSKPPCAGVPQPQGRVFRA